MGLEFGTAEHCLRIVSVTGARNMTQCRSGGTATPKRSSICPKGGQRIRLQGPQDGDEAREQSRNKDHGER